MRTPRDNDPRLVSFARQMRKSSTDTERRLWAILRSRSLSGYKFRRQFPVAGYIVDFYCLKCRVAVELDGGQHGDAGAVIYDGKRTAKLKALGVRVLRFSDREMFKDGDAVAGDILRVLEGIRKPSPLPSPGVPGEGEKGGV